MAGLAGSLAGSLAGRAGGSLAGSRRTLLRWAEMTFARSSVSYLWDAEGKVLYGVFAAGVAAIANIDGKERLQMEGADTNRTAAVSAWTLRGTLRTSGQDDPTGGTGAYLIEQLGTQGANDLFDAVDTGVANAAVGVGIFVLREDSSSVWEAKNSSVATLPWAVDSSALPDAWDRITAQHLGVTVSAGGMVNAPSGDFGLMMLDTGADTDVRIWYPQVSDLPFISSPIAEGATRAADSGNFLKTQVPQRMRSGRWSTELTTMHASTDLATSEVMYLFFEDASNWLGIRENGSGVVEAVLATGGGDITRPITYSRDGTLTFIQDFDLGTFEVANADSGGQAVSGTVGPWPSSTLYVGSDAGPANHIFGRLSEPVGAPVAETSPLTILGAATTGWWNVDNRVMGTPPDVETLTNLATLGGSATQGTAGQRPHLTTDNDVSVQHHEYVNQQFQESSVGSAFYTSGNTDIVVWFSVAFDDSTLTHVPLSLATASTGFGTGFMFRNNLGTVQSRFNLTGAGLHTTAYNTGDAGAAVGMAVYKIKYDGANVRIYINGDLKITDPIVDTFATSPGLVQIGHTPSSGWYHHGNFREAVVFPGSPSASDEAAMDAYMAESAGL